MFSETQPMKKAPFELYPFFKIKGLTMPYSPVSLKEILLCGDCANGG